MCGNYDLIAIQNRAVHTHKHKYIYTHIYLYIIGIYIYIYTGIRVAETVY